MREKGDLKDDLTFLALEQADAIAVVRMGKIQGGEVLDGGRFRALLEMPVGKPSGLAENTLQ